MPGGWRDTSAPTNCISRPNVRSEFRYFARRSRSIRPRSVCVRASRSDARKFSAQRASSRVLYELILNKPLSQKSFLSPFTPRCVASATRRRRAVGGACACRARSNGRRKPLVGGWWWCAHQLRITSGCWLGLPLSLIGGEVYILYITRVNSPLGSSCEGAN